jgi:quercetin dioxygenase-like cupin family protein
LRAPRERAAGRAGMNKQPRIKKGHDMRTTTSFRFVLAAALVAVLGSAAADSSHRMIAAKDLKWADVPSLPAGARIAVIEGPMNEAVPFTVRLSFPANYRLPAHVHPAVERVTVLSGAFYMGMGDKLDASKAMPVGPGDMMIMQPNTPHFGLTKDATVLQLHGSGPWGITYVDPADDPRKKN